MKAWASAVWRELREALESVAVAARERRGVLAGLGAIAVLCYGYELVHFSLSIDEELFPGADKLPVWVAQDRPAVALLKILFGHVSIVPFLGLALSLAFLVASAGIWWLAFETALRARGSRPAMLAFGATFLTCPSLPFYLGFDTYNLEVSIGGALSATAGLFLARSAVSTRRGVALPCCGFLLGASFLVYQSFVPVWLCGAALVLLAEQLESDDATAPSPAFLPRLGFAAAATTTGLAVFEIVLFFCHRFVPKATYSDVFVRWGHDSVWPILRSVATYVASFPEGRAFWGANRLGLTYVVAALALVLAFGRARGRRLPIVLLGLAFVLSPFALAFVLGGPAPIRSLQALAVFVGGAWGLALVVVRLRSARLALGIALVWLVCWQSMQTNRLFFSEYLRWQSDRDTANRILDRVYSLELPREGPVTLVFVGALHRSSGSIFIREEAMGGSFFEWEGGNPWRLIAFVKTLGNDRFTIPDVSYVERARRESEQMPDWPAAGSVTLRDGIVIVKLSAPTGATGS